MPPRLLLPEDPAPFRIIAERSPTPFVLSCDHAGRTLPGALGDLGLPASELMRHIAWDIGAAGVTERLAQKLGAFAILQTYSRLAIDCNRPLDSPTSIVLRSELTDVPGNRELSPEDARARAEAIFLPYHGRIEQELASRSAQARSTVFVAVHSFTPEYMGVKRPWHAGVLYHRDARLARPLLELLRREPGLVVGENEPYSVTDFSDYGVIHYGERRANPYVELEVRQDLIAEASGQAEWAERLGNALLAAVANLPL